MKKMQTKTRTFSRMNTLVIMCIMAMSTSFIWGQNNSPEVKVNGNDVGSWFQNNWIWVVAGVGLVLLIVILTKSSSSKRTTTVVSDKYGDVKQRDIRETRVD